jgi:hypothetical protein
VCRQIYSETALLPFSLNTLVVNGSIANYKNWSTALRPAQRDAIASVEISPGYMEFHLNFPDAKPLRFKPHKPLKGLNRIRISREALDCFAYEKERRYLTYQLAQKDWKPFIVERLNEMEGADVEIEFEEEEAEVKRSEKKTMA